MDYIKFVPRAFVENIKTGGQEDALLISISEPGEAEVRPQDTFKAILRLSFHDVDVSSQEALQAQYQVFDVQMAKQIESFVEAHPDASHIVVHCHAGVSRSAAVALYLGDKLGVPVFNTSV